MPYTPPSVSPSGLHSVTLVKSSSYAGLANAYNSPTLSTKHHPRANVAVHQTHHASHHRRSSGASSPHRAPIPVASFAHDRPAQRLPSPVPRSSSASSSSDDEEDGRSLHSLHDRHLPNLKELRDAIREQLPQRKASSPPGSPEQRPHSINATDNLRPIVTDGTCYDLTASDGEHSSSNTTPQCRSDFPRMVRKKSGEVVKPSLKSAGRRRPLSLPSTPVFPKAVHFDAQLEHVRHFIHSEKPLAVSTNTSPIGEHSNDGGLSFEKELAEMMSGKQYQIELPNFPSHDLAPRRDLPVRAESVYLSNDGRNLVGKVLVKNIAYNKWVVVKFTFDHWQTISEVSATYDSAQNDPSTKDPGLDRFTFSIKLENFTNLDERHMLFCVRYNVVDQEFWDNNYGANYQVEFRKRPNYLLKRASHPLDANGLPRRASDDSALGDEFDIEPEAFAKNLAQQISSPRTALLANLGESPTIVKNAVLTASPSSALEILNRQKRPTGKAFANRYDFEASLSAAIASANVAMAFDGNGLHKPSSPNSAYSSDSYFAPLPSLFYQSQLLQSPAEIKKDSPVNGTKRSLVSILQQQAHHFRSRSYPLRSPPHGPSWPMDDNKDGYMSDDTLDKPSMDSSSYLDFINNYCFVSLIPSQY